MSKRIGSVVHGEQVFRVIIAQGIKAEEVVRKIAHPGNGENPLNHQRRFGPWEVKGGPGSQNGKQKYRPVISEGIVRCACGTIVPLTVQQCMGKEDWRREGILLLKDSDKRKFSAKPEPENGIPTISIWRGMPLRRVAAVANQIVPLACRGRNWIDRNGKQHLLPHGDAASIPKKRNRRNGPSRLQRAFLGLG